MAQPDLTYTLSNNTTMNLCGGNSGKDCADYSYVELIFNNFDSSLYCSQYNYLGLWFQPFGANFYFSPCIATHYQFYPLTVTQVGANSFFGLNNWFQAGGTITVNFYSSAPTGPSGTLSITENGTYDVTNYASAEVDVPPIYGDYHDDLVNINHSIVVASAVILVIYFFWCIYRMIIKPLRS